ncbi:MAG: hypothetical protein K2O99_01755 [Lachnospiraceae bacterium]|nr:hypothetical protein [Lachnospiraceae bacterium]
MQENLRLSRDEIIICYKDDVARLMRYLSWLQEKSGTVTTSVYSGEGIEKSSIAVPTYDSTLLGFIREAKTTDFINRNYMYTLSRYRIRTAADELRVIGACSLQEITVLGDILSKYVLRGNVKGAVWAEGVQNGVYLALLLKLKELMEISRPLEY